eukprot:129509_1
MGVNINSLSKNILEKCFLSGKTVLREYNGPDKNGWVWFPKEEEEIDSSKIHTEDRNEPLCLKDGINVHSLMVPAKNLVNCKEWEVVHRGFNKFGVDVPVGIFLPKICPPFFSLELFVKGPSETSYSKVTLRVGEAYVILPYGRLRVFLPDCEDSNQDDLKVVIFQPIFNECVSMEELDMQLEEFLTSVESPGSVDVLKAP